MSFCGPYKNVLYNSQYIFVPSQWLLCPQDDTVCSNNGKVCPYNKSICFHNNSKYYCNDLTYSHHDCVTLFLLSESVKSLSEMLTMTLCHHSDCVTSQCFSVVFTIIYFGVDNKYICPHVDYVCPSL